MTQIREYETYTRPVEMMADEPLVEGNIIGDVLQLLFRYQDAKQQNKEAQQAEAESAARLVSTERELKKAIAHAYENDEAIRILIQVANQMTVDAPKSQL